MNDLATQIDSLKSDVKRLQQTVDEIRLLVGPFAASFPDGSMLVQTIHGNKYFIDPTDQIMAPQLIVYRQWEQDISQFMLNSVTPDTNFVDVGANFGYFTCMAGSRIGNGGKGSVIGIEPNPKMIRLLHKNIGINWSMCPIEIHECAVSDRDGYVAFNVPEGRAANAGIAVDRDASSKESRIIVPCRKLSDIVNGRRVDILKIDVEGFEVLVLRDLAPILKASPELIVVMEWSQRQMRDAGFSTADFLDILSRFKLVPHRIAPSRYLEPAALAGYRLSHEELAGMDYDNILLIRE